MNPQFNTVHGALAGALVKTGRTGEALAQFQIAVETYPGSAEMHNSYGGALAKNSEFAEAEAEFTKAMRLSPRLVEAQNNLGIALARQGKTDEALTRFRDVIATNPNYAEAHNNLGIALLSGETPNPTSAEREFQVAISINPHYADAQSNLGILYWQQREDAKAEQLFREAIASDFRFIKAYVSLANLLAGESKFAEADAVLQRAEAVAPANAAVQDLRAQLKSQIQR